MADSTLLPTLGSFELIFADAEGGKWYGIAETISGIAETISTLAREGLLVMDDLLAPSGISGPELVARNEKMDQVRAAVFGIRG